jgi:cytochrome c biogenesis protein CcdA
LELSLASYGLGFVAGLLSTLSPCVLPLIPLVLAGAVGAHRRGPLALSFGLALSFAVIGTTIAASGAFLGLRPNTLRALGALLLAGFGLVLLVPPLQARMTLAMSPLGNASGNVLNRFRPTGWTGQLALGLLLGVVWSPCVGPTLGGAVALASQGQQLTQIATLMALFGLGASLPLLLLGQLSQDAMRHWRGHLMRAGQWGKGLLGVLMLLVATSILTGFDKYLETWLIDHSPAWLAAATTRY